MAYDYKIQYKQGKNNKAADALSCLTSLEVIINAIQATTSNLYSDIQVMWQQDPQLGEIINKLMQGETIQCYSFTQG